MGGCELGMGGGGDRLGCDDEGGGVGGGGKGLKKEKEKKSKGCTGF